MLGFGGKGSGRVQLCETKNSRLPESIKIAYDEVSWDSSEGCKQVELSKRPVSEEGLILSRSRSKLTWWNATRREAHILRRRVRHALWRARRARDVKARHRRLTRSVRVAVLLRHLRIVKSLVRHASGLQHLWLHRCSAWTGDRHRLGLSWRERH